LRLARALKKRGIPVIYYVSPQLWAWRRGRIRHIQRDVSSMLVIFPFEEALYRDAGVSVTFVGHPLVDVVRPPADAPAFLRSIGADPTRPVVAILPGSRPKEIAHNLPPLAGAVRRMAASRPDLQFAVAMAPSLPREPFVRALGDTHALLVSGQAHDVVGSASVAIVASGTATVETALLGTPMVVVYRLSALTYRLGRRLVKVPHYAMVNLIAERRIVTELIQDGFTAEAVEKETLALLDDPQRAAAMRADLAAMRARLGGPGASARAAEIVRDWLLGDAKSVDRTRAFVASSHDIS
jgi:lipid-A-disaccharide synthase